MKSEKSQNMNRGKRNFRSGSGSGNKKATKEKKVEFDNSSNPIGFAVKFESKQLPTKSEISTPKLEKTCQLNVAGEYISIEGFLVLFLFVNSLILRFIKYNNNMGLTSVLWEIFNKPTMAHRRCLVGWAWKPKWINLGCRDLVDASLSKVSNSSSIGLASIPSLNFLKFQFPTCIFGVSDDGLKTNAFNNQSTISSDCRFCSTNSSRGSPSPPQKREQQKMLKKAMKEEEKVSREAEKIVKWAKEASMRMGIHDIEDELSDDKSAN
ncbi:hypothetical protein Patl1_04411 [Pistacia atlantica]|uniref:Uncharacterized protein n=1 Tax=Pistacia atlantica TaxID=434234 RepID=A0ACC1BS44_9ROSI|nr:hypothetical protein Patl1_04411 [Pistacia atlantica]